MPELHVVAFTLAAGLIGAAGGVMILGRLWTFAKGLLT